MPCGAARPWPLHMWYSHHLLRWKLTPSNIAQINLKSNKIIKRELFIYSVSFFFKPVVFVSLQLCINLSLWYLTIKGFVLQGIKQETSLQYNLTIFTYTNIFWYYLPSIFYIYLHFIFSSSSSLFMSLNINLTDVIRQTIWYMLWTQE